METVFTSPAMATATAASAPAMASATPDAAAATAASAHGAITPALAELIAKNKYVLKIVEHGPYGYKPNLWLPILFAGLYGASAFTHVGQIAMTKHWWLLFLVFACLAEAGGNGVRVYGHFQPDAVNPYMAQQIILVITPAFFAAIHYALLGRIIELFGSQYTLSQIKPRAITPIFVLLDLASLGIQGAGSGLAAVAEIDSKDTVPGGNIVVIGLCVQLVAYLCFNLLLITFFVKAAASPHTSKNIWWTARFKWFLGAFFLSSVLVFCRSAFRTIEMIFGWIGPVSTVEWYYYAFDCAPVLAAVVLLNLFHPGFVLPANHREAVEEARARRATTGEKRKNRPRSSFYGGGGGEDDVAEMKDVSVLTTSRETHSGRTKPHFRTNSLASGASTLAMGNVVSEKNNHSPDFDGSTFGWSQPQSPNHAHVHRFRQGDDVHRKMEFDGFEPVSAPVTPMSVNDGFAPYHLSPNGKGAVASASTLSPSLYSQGNNKSASSFVSDDFGGGMTPTMVPYGGPAVAPEVHMWKDEGDSTLVQSPSGSSWGHSAEQAASQPQQQHFDHAHQPPQSRYDNGSSWSGGGHAYGGQQEPSQSEARPVDRQSRGSDFAAYAM